MSDPVNSSDEAIHAAAVALANSAKLPGWMQLSALGRDMTPIAQRAVEAAYPVIAAAVRAEAVAGERRRIADEIAQDIHGATLANPELIADFGYNRGLEKAADIARRSGSFDVRASDLLGAWSDDVAAGSVPVATPTGIVRPDGIAYTTDEVAEIFVEQQHSLTVGTPPAAPAARVTRESIERGAAAMRDAMAAPSQPWSDPDHDVAGDMRHAPGALSAAPRPALCEHGSTGSHFESIASQRYGGWCPGPTCEHGQTKPHSFQKLRGGFYYGCPGPVSVPKESSE